MRLTSAAKLLLALVMITPGPVWGAKVIMKDGKIYEGKIIAETDGDILIRTPRVEPRPKLLPAQEILSVVPDPVAVKAADSQRYTEIDMRLAGNVFSSENIALSPAPSLSVGAGLRVHPLVEVGAGMTWAPALSGELSVTDGTTVRTYERFFAYGGGVFLKLFPLYVKRWAAEPFLSVGYSWNRLVPKDSGDLLKGEGVAGGIGVQWPLRQALFIEAGLQYIHTTFDTIDFHGREGTFRSGIQPDSYSFYTGLAIHL